MKTKMSKIKVLHAKNADNSWVAIDKNTGTIIAEGKTPLEASKDIKGNKDIIFSYVTNDSKSYIF